MADPIFVVRNTQAENSGQSPAISNAESGKYFGYAVESKDYCGRFDEFCLLGYFCAAFFAAKVKW
jgi:hypothetical protein